MPFWGNRLKAAVFEWRTDCMLVKHMYVSDLNHFRWGVVHKSAGEFCPSFGQFLREVSKCCLVVWLTLDSHHSQANSSEPTFLWSSCLTHSLRINSKRSDRVDLTGRDLLRVCAGFSEDWSLNSSRIQFKSSWGLCLVPRARIETVQKATILPVYASFWKSP